MRLDSGGVERLEQAHAEDGAGGAGDADDDALHGFASVALVDRAQR